MNGVLVLRDIRVVSSKKGRLDGDERYDGGMILWKVFLLVLRILSLCILDSSVFGLMPKIAAPHLESPLSVWDGLAK